MKSKALIYFYAIILAAVCGFAVACLLSQDLRFYFGLATASDVRQRA